MNNRDARRKYNSMTRRVWWFLMLLAIVIVGRNFRVLRHMRVVFDWYLEYEGDVLPLPIGKDALKVEGQLLSLGEARRFSEGAYSIYQQEESSIIDAAEEEERCKRNGYKYSGRTTRRRIFWGSLLADDSWQVLHAHAAEAYGLYHTAAFVESNTTQMLYKRELRFGPESQNLKRLTESGMFGPDTEVTVDYYYDDKDPPRGLDREHLQRQKILERWQKNGMRPDDLGFLSDADEVMTRDFFRALQICDVPQFEPGQDCREPKILGSTLIFESSPECVFARRRWYHPDIMFGECVELIGDSDVHKPPLRRWKEKHSIRQEGHGYHGQNDYKKYLELHANETNKYNRTMYPLWNGADFRGTAGGSQQFAKYQNTSKVHTAFHFHNFFENIHEVRNKYLTYGHPVPGALTSPLAKLHDDINFTVRCALNLEAEENTEYGRLSEGFNGIVGPKPIFFQNDEYRKKRHGQLKQMIEEDERRIRNSTTPIIN